MKTIFLALAQPNQFSDVLRGEFLPALARRFRVIVLTPAIDGALAPREGYFAHPDVLYERIALSRPKFWMIMDRYLRVPFIREFDHLTYMRHFYRRDHWWPRKMLMRLRVLFPKRLMTVQRLTGLELMFARPLARFRELARRFSPALLITATPGFSPFEAEMVVSARAMAIPTAAVSINYDNLTSNVKRMRRTDYLAVWNERMAMEARTLHDYPDERFRIVGCLRFDHYFTDPADPRFPNREKLLRAKHLDLERPTIVLTGPTPSNYPPRRELVETLIRLRSEDKIAGNPNIFVRIHPNDTLETYRGLEDIPGLWIERADQRGLRGGAEGKNIEMTTEDLLNLTATLRYADVVVNFASTIIIEACIFDRPVINIGFPVERRIVYEFEYNKALLDTGAVRLARDPEELAVLINRYLREPGLDRRERATLVRDYIPFRDGRTFQRTVDFIEEIASDL